MVRIKEFLKKILKKIWGWITWPYYKIQEHRQYKKRIEEIKKRDPYIYK